MTMKKSVVKKAQMGKSVKPTADSTNYFLNKAKKDLTESEYLKKGKESYRASQKLDDSRKSISSANRQKLKGTSGYDKDGYPLTKFRPKSPKQQISEGVKAKKK